MPTLFKIQQAMYKYYGYNNEYHVTKYWYEYFNSK